MYDLVINHVKRDVDKVSRMSVSFFIDSIVLFGLFTLVTRYISVSIIVTTFNLTDQVRCIRTLMVYVYICNQAVTYVCSIVFKAIKRNKKLHQTIPAALRHTF